MSLRITQIVKDYLDRYIRFKPEERFEETVYFSKGLAAFNIIDPGSVTLDAFRLAIQNNPQLCSFRTGAGAPAQAADGLGTLCVAGAATTQASGYEPWSFAGTAAGAATPPGSSASALAIVGLNSNAQPRAECYFRITTLTAGSALAGGYLTPVCLRSTRGSLGTGWLDDGAENVYAILDRSVGSGLRWSLRVKTALGSVNTTTTDSSLPDVVTGVNYKVGIYFDAQRRPVLYVNDRPLITGPIVTANVNYLPYGMAMTPSGGSVTAGWSWTPYYLRVSRRYI